MRWHVKNEHLSLILEAGSTEDALLLAAEHGDVSGASVAVVLPGMKVCDKNAVDLTAIEKAVAAPIETAGPLDLTVVTLPDEPEVVSEVVVPDEEHHEPLVVQEDKPEGGMEDAVPEVTQQEM